MQAGGRRFEPVRLHQGRLVRTGVESICCGGVSDRTFRILNCDSGEDLCMSGVDLCQCESVGAFLGVLRAVGWSDPYDLGFISGLYVKQ